MKCERCGSVFNPAIGFCPICKNNPGLVKKNNYICEKCGGNINSAIGFCPVCKNNEKAPINNNSNNNKSRLIIMIICVLSLIILSIFIITNVNKTPETPNEQENPGQVEQPSEPEEPEQPSDPEPKPEEPEQTSKPNPKPEAPEQPSQPEQKPEEPEQPSELEEITNPKRDRNVIHFISTGSSDAFLIESNGYYGLVDSSNPYNDGTSQSVSNRNETVAKVIDYLDSLGIKYLDYIIATHSHSDHIGGMVEIAKKYVTNKTKYYYRQYDGADDNEPSWDNQGYYNRAVNAMISSGAQMNEITNKTIVFTSGEFELTLLNTDKTWEVSENYNAIGTLIKLGNTKVFLASDIEAEDAKKIMNRIGKVDVLKLNHHGYSGASYDFVNTLQPKYLVVSNNYIHNSAMGPISYLKQQYNTTSYYTGAVSDAIRLHVTSSGYNFENTGRKISLDLTGWITWLDKYMYLENGKIFKGWLLREDKWYYLSEEGIMLTEWQLLEWTGGTSWFYFDAKNGDMLTGWHQLRWSKGENWFYFEPTNGTMVTGLQNLEWSGGKDWFYFDPVDGYMYQDKCVTVNNKQRCFNSDGVCYQGC